MIVEDDVVTREQLGRLLENACFEVVTPQTFEDVPTVVRQMHPDLLLLDMSLPGTNGIDICEGIRRFSNLPIIFVTGSASSMDELNGLLRGGDDYVTKPYQPAILLARITALLKRVVNSNSNANPNANANCNPNPNLLRHRAPMGELILDLPTAALRLGEKRMDLTSIECKVLYHLFEHPNQFITRSNFVEQLWLMNVFTDENTLSVTISRIRKKAQEIGLEDWIESKRGLGYRLITQG
jgi:DNA-binding response OmpR family regulator